MDEVAALGLPVPEGPLPVVTEEALAGLPAPAQRYLRSMGIVGRPRDWSLRAHLQGRFRRGSSWLPCESWQYSSGLGVTRVFHMRLRLGGVLPVVVRDTYVGGRGRMSAKAFDLLAVVDAYGDELDIGELVTYLNDAVLMAPSLLLAPEVSFHAVDDDAFDVSVTHGGRTVTGRVLVDKSDDVVDFSTTDRFFQDPGDRKAPFVRTRWSTPVEGWQTLEGRKVPRRGTAVWHLPSGPYPYADFAFDPRRIEFNVRPGGDVAGVAAVRVEEPARMRSSRAAG